MAKLIALALLLVGFSVQLSEQQSLKSLAALHNKYVGVAIGESHFNDPEFVTVLNREINCLTAEYQMKWGQVEKVQGAPNYTASDQVEDYAVAHSMKVRGHALIWHEEMPPWIEHPVGTFLKNFTADELKKFISDHITSEVTHFKGKFYAWDVVNEVLAEDGTMRETIWYKTLGKQFIIDAFKQAKALDPTVKLYINDYSVGYNNSKMEGLYNLVKELKAAGAPIEGVGFQAHYYLGAVPQDLAKVLQHFVDGLDVEVALTEVDIAVPLPVTPEKLEAQAKDYGATFGACVAVKRCVGITMWGLTDKYSWIPDFTKHMEVPRGAGLPFDEFYKEKPAYKAIQMALSVRDV